jgi:transcriptional regulator with XRE-family HTH domain
MSDYVPQFSEPRSPFKAIADWVKRYREAIGLRAELAKCDAEEVATLARDIGVSVQELNFVVNKGPHAADELAKLLQALGVDPQRLSQQDPVTMRNLERVCIACSAKDECRHAVATGAAAKSYRSFCPNALTLEELAHAMRRTEHTGRSMAP